MHYLGMTALTLTFGWQFAVIAAGLALAAQRNEEAIEHYRMALRRKPDYEKARRNLERAEAARPPR